MKNTLLSILRHVLTGVGVAIVANNVKNHPELSAVDPVTIAGGITAAIGSIWGPVDEHRAEKKKSVNLEG